MQALIGVVIFVGVPVAIGLVIRWVWRRGEAEAPDVGGANHTDPTIPLFPGDHPVFPSSKSR